MHMPGATVYNTSMLTNTLLLCQFKHTIFFLTGFLSTSWPISALEELANYSPALASYWRSFILYSVASEFEHRAHKGNAR
jgi:hypothetical protein